MHLILAGVLILFWRSIGNPNDFRITVKLCSLLTFGGTCWHTLLVVESDEKLAMTGLVQCCTVINILMAWFRAKSELIHMAAEASTYTIHNL